LLDNPKVLIVIGYHPDETLAVQVGEAILRRPSEPHIQIVRYTGKADKSGSVRNLRRFIERFHPKLSIIIHSDDNLGADALIFYRRKAGEKTSKVKRLLLPFALRYDKHPLVFFGISNMRGRAKLTLIDIELGSEMELEKAVYLIESFAKYLASYN